jgi:hypothetical protein
MEQPDNNRLRRYLAKWSAYQIPSVIVVLVDLVCRV